MIENVLLSEKEIDEEKRAILAIQHTLKNSEGRLVLKYLLKSFGVLKIASSVLPEKQYFEETGFNMAGRALFSLVTRANHLEAGLILAEIQKEIYDAEKTSTNERE